MIPERSKGINSILTTSIIVEMIKPLSLQKVMMKKPNIILFFGRTPIFLFGQGSSASWWR